MGSANHTSGNDIKAAQAGYASFINLIKVSVPVIIVIAAVVIFLISRGK